jgi:hypothetical protein
VVTALFELNYYNSRDHVFIGSTLPYFPKSWTFVKKELQKEDLTLELAL